MLQEDARLATFDEFLSEHWDIGIVLGYLQGSNLALQAAAVPCIDYPARASEANAQPFICLRKASFIADAVLGTRNEKAKERFLQVRIVQQRISRLERVLLTFTCDHCWPILALLAQTKNDGRRNHPNAYATFVTNCVAATTYLL